MNNFSEPQKILNNIGMGAGSVVVDLGSGSGHYARAAAQLIGPEGRVYAVDVQHELLERIATESQEQGISNIEIIHADIEIVRGTKLQDNVADSVLLCNTLFQLEDKASAITEASRIMRPNGRLIVIDWTDSHNGLGPDSALICDQSAATELLQSSGFVLEKEFSAGDHHYGVIARQANNISNNSN